MLEGMQFFFHFLRSTEDEKSLSPGRNQIISPWLREQRMMGLEDAGRFPGERLASLRKNDGEAQGSWRK